MGKVKYIQPVKCHVKKDIVSTLTGPENPTEVETTTEAEIPIHLYDTAKAKALSLEELRDAYYISDMGLHIYIRERNNLGDNFYNFSVPALLDELYGSTLIAIWAYDSYYYEKDYGKTWIAYLENPF